MTLELPGPLERGRLAPNSPAAPCPSGWDEPWSPLGWPEPGIHCPHGGEGVHSALAWNTLCLQGVETPPTALRKVNWPPQTDAGFSTEATIGFIVFFFPPPLHPYYGVS